MGKTYHLICTSLPSFEGEPVDERNAVSSVFLDAYVPSSLHFFIFDRKHHIVLCFDFCSRKYHLTFRFMLLIQFTSNILCNS